MYLQCIKLRNSSIFLIAIARVVPKDAHMPCLVCHLRIALTSEHTFSRVYMVARTVTKELNTAGVRACGQDVWRPLCAAAVLPRDAHEGVQERGTPPCTWHPVQREHVMLDCRHIRSRKALGH
jgi:hypothetical protein